MDYLKLLPVGWSSNQRPTVMLIYENIPYLTAKVNVGGGRSIGMIGLSDGLSCGTTDGQMYAVETAYNERGLRKAGEMCIFYSRVWPRYAVGVYVGREREEGNGCAKNRCGCRRATA